METALTGGNQGHSGKLICARSDCYLLSPAHLTGRSTSGSIVADEAQLLAFSSNKLPALRAYCTSQISVSSSAPGKGLLRGFVIIKDPVKEHAESRCSANGGCQS